MVSGNQIRAKEMSQLEPWSELACQRWVQGASVHTQKAGSEKLYKRTLQLAYGNTVRIQSTQFENARKAIIGCICITDNLSVPFCQQERQ